MKICHGIMCDLHLQIPKLELSSNTMSLSLNLFKAGLSQIIEHLKLQIDLKQ